MKNAKEFLLEKYPCMEGAHWNKTANDDDWTVQMMEEYADQFKPKPKKEVKRYFSASYQGFYNDGTIRGGNVHFDCNTYPPRWWIEDKIKELDSGIYRAMILSIQEMTKEDYESFISKEN